MANTSALHRWRVSKPEAVKEHARKNHAKRMLVNRGSVLVLQAKTRAARRGLDFDLTTEWANEAIYLREVCEVSGVPFVLARDATHRHPQAPSIDRIENDGPYTRANCRVVCWFFNMAFNTYGEEVFAKLAQEYLRYAKH